MAPVVDMPSRSKGALLEHAALEICSDIFNLDVQSVADKELDAIVDGYAVEIKSSMCWENQRGNWVWQQIRRFHKYERMIFMGVDPDRVLMFWCTKTDLDHFLFPYDKNIQHGGRAGHQQLYWLHAQFGSGEFPHYLKPMTSF